MSKFNLPNEYDGITFSDKQLEPLKLMVQGKNFIILNGSIRIGKSLIASMMFAMFIQDGVSQGKYYEYGCQAFKFENAWKNLTRRVAMFLYYELGFTNIRISNSTIVHDMFRVYTYGASSSRSDSTIQGDTLRGVLTDEAAKINLEAVEMARSRTLTFKKNGLVIHTTNPEGPPTHPYYKQYIANKKSAVVNFHLLDSPLFTQTDVEEYREIFSPIMFQQKIEGKWVAAEGSVYFHKLDVVKEIPDKFKYLNFGIDEGRTDATVCHAIGITDDDHWYVLATYYHKNGDQQKTYTEIAEEISMFITRITNQYRAITNVFGDTTPGVTIQYLKNDKSIPPRVGIDYARKNEIQKRIDMTVALMGLGRLHIHESCIELIEAFETAVYKNDVRLDNGTSDIDSLDAFEYGIEEDMNYINDVLLWKEEKSRSDYE